jgi:hypothetical protein
MFTVRNAGTVSLDGGVLRVTTPATALRFGAGAGAASVEVPLPSLAPFAETRVEVPASLRNATFDARLALSAQVVGRNLPASESPSQEFAFAVHYDVADGSSKSDTFDTPSSPWSTASAPTLDRATPWQRVPSGTGWIWRIPNAGAAADHSLVSPDMVVAANEDFTFTLEHRYSFEWFQARGQTYLFDGGVVEYTTDGGATWNDAAERVSPAYGGALFVEESANPLAGRRAFVADSAGYPAFVTTRVAFGRTLAGKTVRIRLRHGADQAAGAPGWEVRSVTVAGTTNSPFPAKVAPRACTP